MNKKTSFKNDYSEGVYPLLLDALSKTNDEQLEGYGLDKYSVQAKMIIQEKLNINNCDIHFLVGGTQTNRVFIKASLKSYESVISSESGHINVHEAGAIENVGHKINFVKSENGKITPSDIEMIVKSHTDEHMVKPALVYISNSTELGTIYTLSEIEDIYRCCRNNGLLLYMDGARLAQALSSPFCDYKLSDIHGFFDGYYIGGTKNGLFAGEALVINNENLKKDFRYYIKQAGGLLAKGRLLGVQFYEIFRSDLYFDLAKNAVDKALALAEKLSGLGIRFKCRPETNQIFPIFSNELIKYLYEYFDFYIWESMDRDFSVARIVTSWATTEKHVDNFFTKVKGYLDEKGRQSCW
ncbi:MAG: threonine aldolase [Deferribacteres bacterium]|nr:threonine aldolase [Deferribacteres bacterium]